MEIKLLLFVTKKKIYIYIYYHYYYYHYYNRKNILILIKSLYTDNGAKYKNPIYKVNF